MNSRKAAILVTSLEPATADALLRQMDPDEAQRVRQAVEQLAEVDDHERATVIDEFFESTPVSAFRPAPSAPPRPAQTPADVASGGVELGESLRRRLQAETPYELEPATADAAADREPFRFLEDAPAAQVAACLSAESPQTIALVLAHLTPAHAAQVLDGYDAGLQRDVVDRLVHLEQTHPDVIREVQDGLQSRVADPAAHASQSPAGAELVQRILDAADRGLERRIIHNLAQHDRDLAEAFARPPLSTNDLYRLSRAEWMAVLGSVGEEILALALAASPLDFAHHVLGSLSSEIAGRLYRLSSELGPTSLVDLDHARQELFSAVEHLVAEGQVRLDAQTVTSLVA